MKAMRVERVVRQVVEATVCDRCKTRASGQGHTPLVFMGGYEDGGLDGVAFTLDLCTACVLRLLRECVEGGAHVRVHPSPYGSARTGEELLRELDAVAAS